MKILFFVLWFFALLFAVSAYGTKDERWHYPLWFVLFLMPALVFTV